MMDSFKPDALLLDIGMLGLDGYEVIRRIRAQPNHAAVLMIAVTGWGQERGQRLTIASNLHHHLIKSVDLEQWYKILAQ
jgi:CheY-like chemotaxis protein